MSSSEEKVNDALAIGYALLLLYICVIYYPAVVIGYYSKWFWQIFGLGEDGMIVAQFIVFLIVLFIIKVMQACEAWKPLVILYLATLGPFIYNVIYVYRNY
jgi:hypothetical protein